MGRNSGGVRSNNPLTTKFKKDASNFFNRVVRGNNQSIDYSGHDTKWLKKLQKIGESYKPSEKSIAIAQYVSSAEKRTKGKFMSINHAHLDGLRSELISVANRAKIHKNLDLIKAELKKRK